MRTMLYAVLGAAALAIAGPSITTRSARAQTAPDDAGPTVVVPCQPQPDCEVMQSDDVPGRAVAMRRMQRRRSDVPAPSQNPQPPQWPSMQRGDDATKP